MSDIYDNLKGIGTRYQSDIVANTVGGPDLHEEVMEDHPLGVYGLTEKRDGIFDRMDEFTISETIRNLFRSRPSMRLLDVTPKGLPYVERKLMVSNPAGYRLTMAEKAAVLAKAVAKDEQIHGFKMLLENVDGPTSPTLSLSVYEVTEELSTAQVPLEIFVRWRSRF